MNFRRLLLVAAMVVLFWSAPAQAQTSYGDVLGETQTSRPTGQVGGQSGGQTTGQVGGRSGGGVASQATSGTGSSAGGNLARTGQDNIGPMIQFAFVLVGAGTLLVLVARRRNTGRSSIA